MQINELTRMVRWTQLYALEMAFFATEGVVDFGMADEAVGHARQMGCCREIGFFNAAVTGLAGVAAVEMLSGIAGVPEVLSTVDCRREDGG